MAGKSGEDDATVAKAAAVIVSRLYDQLDDLTRSTHEFLVTEISELRGDTQLLQLLRDTVASNIDTFFAAIRHRIPVEQVEPPAAALEYARRLAQRDVSANALVRASAGPPGGAEGRARRDTRVGIGTETEPRCV